jgi:flagellar hook-associated protein 2
MSITFGGLATGLDTSSIVDQLMALERQPITRLETDKTWMNTRLAALTEFDAKLSSFLSKIEDLDSSEDLRAKKITLGSDDFFTATASSDALPASYQIEVVTMAQVEKDVSTGYADKAAQEFGTGTITLTVGTNDPVDIAIDSENNSLEGIMAAINEADAGVAAAIINDGTGTPYRMVLTGQDIAAGFTVDAAGLSGGSCANPVFTETQVAQQAHIKVDNIDIYSDGNTLSEAIPGVTLTLNKAEEGTTTNLGVSLDENAVKSKIQAFVSGYNEVVSFVTSQSKTQGSSGGVLGGDSGLNSIKRHLQNMLVTMVDNSGVFRSMSQLGLETQTDGTLQIDDDTLTQAIQNNLDSVETLLAGEEGVEGIATRFKDYLDGITNSTDGFLVGRKESIESNVKRIDARIEQMEMRLENREKNLLNKFNALEELVSTLNAQGDYLSQQIDLMKNLWSQKK